MLLRDRRSLASAPILSRRGALRGAAAAALGLGGAAVTLPATASATPPLVSAEATALQAELARLSSTYRWACREADETNAATADVEPPEELYARHGDVSRLGLRVPVLSWASPDRRWWGEADLIDSLRLDTFRFYSGGEDHVAVARRDEIVGAWDRWKAAELAAENASGHTAAQTRFEAAFTAYDAFRARLVEMRTSDPEVLTVKALAIADVVRGREDALGQQIERAMKRDCGAYEDALALSLARDFLGLLDTDRRGGARV